MLESVRVDSAVLADGTEFVLDRRGDDWMVRVGGRMLMSSRMHDSEKSLAECAIERAPDPSSVLVGGLGLGFTLRAVLDRVSRSTKVTVAELVPSLIEWNRKHVGVLADHPLEDPRVTPVVGDVFDTIRRSPAQFDVILLDVDNGPVALSNAANQRLYSEYGVRTCRAALKPNGVMALWSAGPNARFERRMTSAGFEVEVLRVPARNGSRASCVLFLGRNLLAKQLPPVTEHAGQGANREAASRGPDLSPAAPRRH
jgi:spermidine synthase